MRRVMLLGVLIVVGAAGIARKERSGPAEHR